MEGGDDVVEVVFEGMGDGFPDVGEGGEVHHHIDAFLLQNGANSGLVSEIRPVEGHSRGHGGAVAEHQGVDDDRSVTSGEQMTHAMAADVPGTAGDKNVRGNFETDWRGLYCAQGTVG